MNLKLDRARAFLFDLDGVLTDTSELHFKAWRQLAEELGLTFTREDNEALRGVSRRASLDLLLKGKPCSEQQAAAWMDLKNDYYLELVEQMTPQDLLPGTLDVLWMLRERGIKTAIVSSSKNARLVVERLKLGRWVDELIDGNAPVPSKPAPDLFILAAQRLGVQAGECVVVEDAEAGIEAARAGGMQCVGLGPQQRVGQADLVCQNLVELRSFLQIYQPV
ncbi:MAG TPA: beta-phosphoglucomutase [Anaerolineaceae bacterium]|nr:beta-phosphoglucomutase [Anaerolineaceae bacterium]HPN51635.1 beta-phosphoglucomutase [Anaerolineaceae bacterium]